MFQQPNYSTKQKENVIINGFIHQHDCFCTCNEPAFHCASILLKKLGPELSTQNKKQLQQCLGTTTDTTAAEGGDVDNLDFGDLDKLFEEDVTEDNDG